MNTPRSTMLSLFTLGVVLLSAGSSMSDDEKPTLATHDRWVTSVAFAPDGQTLFTAGGESLMFRPGDVLAWDMAGGNQRKAFEGHDTNVWCVAVTSDGATIATSGYDGKVILWDAAQGKAKHTLEHKGWVRRVAFSPDGITLAVAGEDGTVKLWNAESGEAKQDIKAHEAAVYGLEFSPDGKQLATAGIDKLVKLWNAADGTEQGKLEGHEDAVWDVKYSPDGSTIASAGADRTVRIWNSQGQLQATLVGHSNWVTSLAFSSDGKQLASGSHDRTARIWNLEPAMKLSDMAAEVAQKVRDARLAHSEAELAAEAAAREAGDAEAKVERLQKSLADQQDAKKQEELKKELAEAEKAVPTALQQRDTTKARSDETGKQLTAAQQESNQLQAQMAVEFPPLESSIWSVALSPDGKRLAVGSHREGATIWNVEDRSEVFPSPESKK